MDEKKLIRDQKFPSNRENEPKVAEVQEREKKAVIVKGAVVRKKKGLLAKSFETLVGDDVQDVGAYIWYDVLIPALKTTITDMVTGGIEMALFGEKRSSSSRSNLRRVGGKTYTSYGSYYESSKDPRRDRRSSYGGRSRDTHSFDDIIFETRGEAENVLSHLVDLTIDYEAASVADLYDLAGLESSFTDDKWGWTNLREATTERIRAGYIIRLPRPRPLD